MPTINQLVRKGRKKDQRKVKFTGFGELSVSAGGMRAGYDPNAQKAKLRDAESR